MEKLQLNLDILLPEIPDERDKCVGRIIEQVQRYKGIAEVHIIPADENSRAKLCFHYHPSQVSIDEVQRIAEKEGAEITKKFRHILVEVNGILTLEQAEMLEHRIGGLKGVMFVSVSGTGHIRIEFDQDIADKRQLLALIEKAGYRIAAYVKGAPPKEIAESAAGAHHDTHEHERNHGEEDKWKIYLPAAVSFLMLAAGILADNFIKPSFFTGIVRFAWYALAYLPVGLPVAKRGILYAFKGDMFTEFMLMFIATAGAFCIGEYPEGVAVMLFYTIGEFFQDAAVNRAKNNIKALLDIRPDTASVLRNGVYQDVHPETVQPGDIIRVKAGERVPLDGKLLSAEGSFNTMALTGESLPQTISKGGTALAGMINQQKTIELSVIRAFSDSSLSRILALVQEAASRKAKTEQFIRRFSRVYTPIVVLLALSIVTLPYLFMQDYVFRDWLYKSLIFLVISCPCALVISIPLGYFGGIGAASRNGILFKGSNFLDLIRKVDTVVMDKTGTLTKGVFRVQQVVSANFPEEEWLALTAALTAVSTHPASQAVTAYASKLEKLPAENTEELSGYGIKGRVNGREVLVGNLKLLEKMGVAADEKLKAMDDTLVAAAIEGQLAGYAVIADELKSDSRDAVEALHAANIRTIILSGDKQAVVDRVAGNLGVDTAYGDLLPEDKVRKIEELKAADPNGITAFVGDGINDAPVLAGSDIGIAMGGLGSDAAIETADVVIQTDQPSKIVKAIAVGKAANRVVWQNISLAFGVKLLVMALGVGGLATLWEAVFADVGVALLAIFNAMRIQRMKF